jgi:hypothetical protein
MQKLKRVVWGLEYVIMKFVSDNFVDSDGGFEPLLAYNKLFQHEALIGKKKIHLSY